VTATLRGAAADRARQDELRSGLLKAELRAPGFEAFAGGAPPAELVGRPETPALRPPAKETVADRRERERVERAEGALRVAESEVSDWHRRAEELDGILAERRTAAQHAKRAVDDLRTRLREAEQRLSQTEHAAEQAEREAVRARHEADRATARRRAAEQAVRRARE